MKMDPLLPNQKGTEVLKDVNTERTLKTKSSKTTFTHRHGYRGITYTFTYARKYI